MNPIIIYRSRTKPLDLIETNTLEFYWKLPKDCRRPTITDVIILELPDKTKYWIPLENYDNVIKDKTQELFKQQCIN